MYKFHRKPFCCCLSVISWGISTQVYNVAMSKNLVVDIWRELFLEENFKKKLQLSIIRYCDITVKPFLIRTPHWYGQFVLFLEKKSPCIFLKFQPLKTDTMLIWTLSTAPIMSILVSLLIRTAQRRRRQKPCV